PDDRSLDQYLIGWFHEMNRALGDTLEQAALVARLHDNVARMRWLAGEILSRARKAHPHLDDRGLDGLLAGVEHHPSLDPTWYADAA
ncbi:MAG TPA: halogenase, partial [Luteimonas sp.]|nr:halogenase [Luteimonas sp.]